MRGLVGFISTIRNRVAGRYEVRSQELALRRGHLREVFRRAVDRGFVVHHAVEQFVRVLGSRALEDNSLRRGSPGGTGLTSGTCLGH